MLQADQGAGPPAGGAAQGNQKKFECPSDFIPCPVTPVPSLTPENLNDSSTELWLIKAPLDFDPASFNSKKIPLIGFQSLKIKNDGKKRFYNVFSSPREIGTSHLIVPSPENDRLQCGPPFQGYINICNSFGDPSGMLYPVPASPILQIPEGLKQRFQPFGAMSPVRRAAKRGHLSEQPGEAGQGESNEGGEQVVKRRKKKKQKKQKDDAAFVEEETVGGEGFSANCPETIEDQEESLPEEAQSLQSAQVTTKKRKKKKREKDRVEVTALEMEDNLENEARPAAVEEEAAPAESVSDETDCTRPRKKKRKHLSQELLEEQFAPTADELGSVFKKKKHRIVA